MRRRGSGSDSGAGRDNGGRSGKYGRNCARPGTAQHRTSTQAQQVASICTKSACVIRQHTSPKRQRGPRWRFGLVQQVRARSFRSFSRRFRGALCLRMPRPLPWAVDLQNFNKRFLQEWGRIPKTTESRKANPRTVAVRTGNQVSLLPIFCRTSSWWPGCAADGQTYQEAASKVEAVMGEWIETARSLKRPIPVPSGK